MHPGRDGGPKIEEVQDKTPQKETSAKSTKIFGIFWQFLRGITASDHPDYHIFPKTEKTRFFHKKSMAAISNQIDPVLPAASWKALPKGRFSFLEFD